MFPMSSSDLADSRDRVTQESHAIDSVVSGVLPGVPRQARHLRRTTGAQLGTTYKTGWYMLKRIRAAMGQREKRHLLSGIIEVDDAYFGGPVKKRGQGTEKAKVFVALSLDEQGNPRYLKMQVTENILLQRIKIGKTRVMKKSYYFREKS